MTWLTTEEAAAEIGITVASLRRLTKLRRYRPTGPRGRILYKPADIKAYLESTAEGEAPRQAPPAPLGPTLSLVPKYKHRLG